MRLEQLLYLIKIAESGSIHNAANELYVSHQAINEAITLLEHEYHAKLLEHTHNGCVLTKDGAYVVEVAQQILALSMQLQDYFAADTSDECGSRLTIISFESCQKMLLPLVLTEFLKKHSAICFDSKAGNLSAILQTLKEKRFDLGFINIAEDTLREIEAPLHFFALKQAKYIALVSGESPLAKNKTVSIKTLLKNKYISIPNFFENGISDTLLPILKLYGEVDLLKVDSEEIAYKYIEANLGFALTSSFGDVPSGLNIFLKPLREPIKTTVGYIVHEDNLDNVLIKEFVSSLKTKLK